MAAWSPGPMATNQSADFWTCAGNGDGWHSIRETVSCQRTFEDFLDLANVLLIFSSFHNFASISAWVFFIQELQQEVPTRHFGSFASGWEAGKLHCSHINNTQARYMMYEEISPGLRNCFLSVLD